MGIRICVKLSENKGISLCVKYCLEMMIIDGNKVNVMSKAGNNRSRDRSKYFLEILNSLRIEFTCEI